MVKYMNRAQAVVYEFAAQFLNTVQKVIIPANVCASVPLTYQKLNIPYEVVDIDIDTLAMDLKWVGERLKSEGGKYQAIHYVCTYGNYSDIDVRELLKLRSQYDVKIIVDKCLCMPDIEFEKTCQVDLELYSTGYAKCVNLGFGGFAYINNIYADEWKSLSLNYSEDDFDKMKVCLKNDKWKEISSLNWLKVQNITDVGEYKNSIIRSKEQIIKHKSRINKLYEEIIPVQFQMPQQYNIWRYNIRLSNPDFVERKIFETGELFVSRHYKPVKANEECEGNMRRFPNAEKVYSHIMNLFNDLYYDTEKAEKTAKLVKEYGILNE